MGLLTLTHIKLQAANGSWLENQILFYFYALMHKYY